MMGKMKCALLLLLAFCMLFTGCVQKTMPPDNGDTTLNENVIGNAVENNGNDEGISMNQGLNSMNNGYGSAPSSIFFCDYKSEKMNLILMKWSWNFFRRFIRTGCRMDIGSY